MHHRDPLGPPKQRHPSGWTGMENRCVLVLLGLNAIQHSIVINRCPDLAAQSIRYTFRALSGFRLAGAVLYSCGKDIDVGTPVVVTAGVHNLATGVDVVSFGGAKNGLLSGEAATDVRGDNSKSGQNAEAAVSIDDCNTSPASLRSCLFRRVRRGSERLDQSLGQVRFRPSGQR